MSFIPRRARLLATGLFVSAMTAVASGALGDVLQRPGPPVAPKPGAGAPATSTNQITSISLIPAAPQPDQPFRVRIEGVGTCKGWFLASPVDGAKGVPGFNPSPVAGELTRPPDINFPLPGELAATQKLPAGRWKLRVDAHERLGGNCKGYAEVEVQIGAAPLPPIAARPGGPLPVAPAVNNKAAPIPSGAPAQPTPTPPTQGPVSGTGPTSIQRVTGVTLIPSSPQPDQPIRVRVDGAGSCKLWLGLSQLDGSTFMKPPPGFNPIPLVNELTRPADATVALPGDVTPLKLGAGRYKLVVSTHEMLAGSNCKGGAELEFVVAVPAPVPVQPRPVAPTMRAR